MMYVIISLKNNIKGDFMDLLIDVGVPIFTALISGIITYFVTVKEQNSKLKETKLTLEQEIERLEKFHQQKLELLEKEVELQQKSKEGDIITELTKEFMVKALSNPSEFEKLKDIAKKAEELKSKGT